MNSQVVASGFISVILATLLPLLSGKHCEDAETSLLQSTAATSTLTVAEDERIPCIIHQIWNGSLKELPQPKASYVKSWTDKNPSCQHKFWSNAEIEALVQSKSPDQIAPIWAAMSQEERSDIFRYLVLYDQGGYFAELTVSCEKPIKEYKVPKTATMLVGYEYGHRWPEKQRLEVNFARTEQFANYFFASAPRNPVLGRVLEMVRERFDWQIQSEDMAGAAALSDAVHEFLEESTPDAVAKENHVRKEAPTAHFLSYASQSLYGQDMWKVWLLPAGSVNSAPQVATDDPSEAGELLVSRHNP